MDYGDNFVPIDFASVPLAALHFQPKARHDDEEGWLMEPGGRPGNKANGAELEGCQILQAREVRDYDKPCLKWTERLRRLTKSFST